MSFQAEEPQALNVFLPLTARDSLMPRLLTYRKVLEYLGCKKTWEKGRMSWEFDVARIEIYICPEVILQVPILATVRKLTFFLRR
jgi:hypothetical protein